MFPLILTLASYVLPLDQERPVNMLFIIVYMHFLLQAFPLVLVSVNDSRILGGHPRLEGQHGQQSTLLNYSGQMVDPPLCEAHQPMDGWLLLEYITKTAAGGAEEAAIAGPWDLAKYISTVYFVGLSPTSTVIAPTHPPLPYCANTTSEKLKKFVSWVNCFHPITAKHKLKSFFGNSTLNL